MTQDEINQAIARAKSLQCWQDPQDVMPLEGGITNVNLKLTDCGKKYVVRLGADIPEHGILRFNELAISRAAHLAGVSPEVVHAEPGVLVLEYVDANPLTEADFKDETLLSDTVQLIKRVHTGVIQHLRGPILTFWVFHVLRDYAALLTERESRHVSDLAALMDDAMHLESSIGPIQLVLGHNDLLPANILRNNEKMWLIDWEYGGFNSPLFDLGGLASNNNFSAATENQMLEIYFGSEPDKALLQSYKAMKCASLLRESMWSMVSEITSKLDFDYSVYTAENMDRYKAAMAAAGFKTEAK